MRDVNFLNGLIKPCFVVMASQNRICRGTLGSKEISLLNKGVTGLISLGVCVWGGGRYAFS